MRISIKCCSSFRRSSLSRMSTRASFSGARIRSNAVMRFPALLDAPLGSSARGQLMPLAGGVAHTAPTLLSRRGEADGSGASGHAEHIGTVSARGRASTQGKRPNSHMGLLQKCSKLGGGKLQNVSDGLCCASLLALWMVYGRIII
ncbi:unnamed protein product [Ixodes persulcatus]